MRLEKNPYDLLDYPGHTRPQAHPRRLQTIAWLHGLATPGLAACRVLELGCGDGLQLLWIAGEFPGSCCVGVDLAATGLQRGRAMATALGLANVELHHGDIMEMGPELGLFDYIVAHGLYSWVSEPVADRLLSLCARHLVPDGVAFVSYNVLPAQHLRRMVDEMARYHVRTAADPEEAVIRARAFLPVLQGWLTQDPVVAPVIDFEAGRWQELADHTVFHDDLAATNRPEYFSEFAARAAGHGLQYLGEAGPDHLQRMAQAGALLQEIVPGAASRIEREQYMDFARGAAFRQSLLCHDGRVVAEHPDPAALEQLSFAANFSIEGSAAARADGEVVFAHPDGARVTLKHPRWKAALGSLAAAWPGELPFGELLRSAHSAAVPDGAGEEVAEELSQCLMQLFAAGLLEAGRTPIDAARQPGERPEVFPLARLLAGRRAEIPSLRGKILRIHDPLLRRVIQLLDGSRERAEVIRALAVGIESGELPLPDRLKGRFRVEPLEELLRPVVEESLLGLAQSAMLLA